MAYVPVAQRAGAGAAGSQPAQPAKSGGYVPVAQRNTSILNDPQKRKPNLGAILLKGPQSKIPANQSTPLEPFGERFAAPPKIEKKPPVIPEAGPQSRRVSLRENLTKPALAAAGKVLDAFDVASGSVAFAPARVTELATGKKLGSSGVPLRFSEGATEATKASGLPKEATAPIGLLAGMIGDPLNLIGGGPAKAIGAIQKVKNETEALSFFAKMGVPADIARNFAGSAARAKTDAAAREVLRGVEAAIRARPRTYVPVARRTAVKPSTAAKTTAAAPKNLGEAMGVPGAAAAKKTTLHPDDQSALVKVIDAVRLKGKSEAPKVTERDWLAFERIMTRTGHSLDTSLAKLANKAEDLIRGKTDSSALYTTGRRFVGEKKKRVRTEAFGAGAGFQQDEDGEFEFDPAMAALGVLGLGIAQGTPHVLKEIKAVTSYQEAVALAKKFGFSEDIAKKAASAFKGAKTDDEARLALEKYSKLEKAAQAEKSEIASLERTADLSRMEEDVLADLPISASAKDVLSRRSLAAAKGAVDEAKLERDILRETTSNMPGKDLKKYESRTTGELPEVTGKKTMKSLTGSGKTVKNSEFGQRGDTIVEHVLGFKDLDEANEAFEKYKVAREHVKEMEESVRSRVSAYRDRKAVFDEVVRFVQQEGAVRRDKVKAVQDFFKLGNDEMKKILQKERDVRLMTDGEFSDFLKRIQGLATEAYLRKRPIVDLAATIFEKEFVKLDNLRKALKLPRLEYGKNGQIVGAEKWTTKQVQEFDELLQTFKKGDEFLGVRQLQTVKNTDLAGIHTRREAQEKLLAQINKERAETGKAAITLDELQNISAGEADRFLYDTALALRNPFYELMVQEKNKAFLNADAVVFNEREKINDLFKAARASRKRTFIQKLVPLDYKIFRWLEANDADKLKLAEEMTAEEIKAGAYIRDRYAEMRDYLMQQGTLKKYIGDYITHIRRGFLEAWREEGSYVAGEISGTKPSGMRRFGRGLVAAFKEVFDKYKQDAAYFNILDQRTDQILPLEKFFQYSMKRSGELVPSKNVAKAYLQYISTFEKKRALDSIVPKLDIYVNSLTPKKLTPRGLEFDRSLKNFFKEWMNSKKGRATDRALIKPGGKMDWALRTGVALTRIIDLGLSIPVGVAANFGAQTAAYRGLGEAGYALGTSRLFTPKGRAVVEKYRNFVGEPVLQKAFSAEGTLGDSVMNGVFGLFSFADRKARQVFLLGKMSPEEWAKGEIATDQLARLQTELGRHLPIDGFESVFGKTALGSVGKQYKSWAVPLLASTADDLMKLHKAIKTGDSAFLKSPEFAELLRTTIVSAAIGYAVYGIVNSDKPQKEMTFSEKMLSKVAQDSLSLIGALDPTLWSGTPRLLQFLNDLSIAAKQIVTIDRNKEGDLTGPSKLQRTLTPGAVRQVAPAEKSKEKKGNSKMPKMPDLPKMPELPEMPKI